RGGAPRVASPRRSLGRAPGRGLASTGVESGRRMRANPEIDALLAELLDSGVSPKYVSRLAGELADHQADLEAEAARFGLPGQEAAADAKLRLGDCSVIAKEFALRPELKSWVYRCRWLEPLLRFVVAGYLLVRAPARLVAAGQ